MEDAYNPLPRLNHLLHGRDCNLGFEFNAAFIFHCNVTLVLFAGRCEKELN